MSLPSALEAASLPAPLLALWGADATVGFVTDSGSITRIRAYLGEPTQAPRIAPPARGPPWQEYFDTREGDTVALSERAVSESQGQAVALLGTRPRPAQTPLPAATRTTQLPTGPSDATVPVAKPR